MKLFLLSTLAAASIIPTCSRSDAPEPAPYDPSEVGTVSHALCLLGFTGVPLRELSTGHHVVEVSLNGRPGTFVLDTGANATVVHSGYAAQFALSERATASGPAVGVGGATAARQVRIDSFAIGAVPIRQRRIMTTDLSSLTGMLAPLAGRPIHGIVGQDVMKEHRVVVDVSGPVVHLIEADREPAPVPAAMCRKPDSNAARVSRRSGGGAR